MQDLTPFLPAGNRTGLNYPNGMSVAYTYDINNRLTNLEHKNSLSQIIASYAYTLGPIGNRTQIDESSGIVRQYEYDDLYRLTKDQVTDPNNTQTYQTDYTYDAVGNRLTKVHDSVLTTDYTYNNADQLVTENGITYTYDLNGNLTSKTDGSETTTYSYYFDNRLISSTSPSGTVSYKYDVDGNRVETTTSAGTTHYIVDTNRSLSQILAEYLPDGTLVASYVYADDLISMTRDSQTYYYHFDGLGSTRLLTDSGGNITDTYDYDAFGNLINRSGTTENPFLFTGQQYDSNIGFYYLRARYYQPGNGRFISFDPFVGDPYAPMSLHKYLYAGDDPVNKIDPSGEQVELGGFLVSISISNILSAIAAPSFAVKKRLEPEYHFYAAGVWTEDTNFEDNLGQGVVIKVKNVNVLGTTIAIDSNFNQYQDLILLPHQKHEFKFFKFGPEPIFWKFRVITRSDAFTVEYEIRSTWVPGMPPNR